MMYRVYKKDIKSSQDITLKYQDEGKLKVHDFQSVLLTPSLVSYNVYRRRHDQFAGYVLREYDALTINSYKTDDIDITHAISISNLLKVTIYDKSSQATQQQQRQNAIEISTLMEIRDKLNQLIQSLDIQDKDEEEAKKEQTKKIHRLTPAELGNTTLDSNCGSLY